MMSQKYVAVLIAGIAVLIILSFSQTKPSKKSKISFEPPDNVYPQPPSWSELRSFKRGVVIADGAPCARIGKSMLENNGSAVDAALAALICNGLINMQSMGIGGGFFMTIYDHVNQRAVTLNARERAPKAAATLVYDSLPPGASQYGPMAIAVPGEIAGYWETHSRFGKLPWADLFAPSIALCEDGYSLTKVQYESLDMNRRATLEDPTLREWFIDETTGVFKMPDSIIRPKQLCRTLRLIAEGNATEFYNGSLGRIFVEDLRSRGSIVTTEDLADYRVEWRKPISARFSSGDALYTVGLPGSGPLLAFVLNIIDGYGFDETSVASWEATLTNFHRIIEAYKHAFAFRTELGDPEFVDMTLLQYNLSSREFADRARSMINDRRTSNDPRHYGAVHSELSGDHGTAHISVVSENGDAVSVTSSINIYFGSGVVSPRTGILSSSSMDDFSTSATKNYFDLPPSMNNRVEPGKRPVSSMSPSIIVDRHGDVRMVVGAAGGTKIITAISFVIAGHLWLKNTIKEAIDAARIHHQLFPMEISYEYGVLKSLIDGLRNLGHKTSRYRERGSVVSAIVKINGTLYSNVDYRKGGDTDGLD